MTPAEKPLISKQCLLEKFPGKGGWTYAAIPEIPVQKSNPFGWLRVKGSIDDYSFEHYHLMPMGNGALFLPVKAAIRKQIKKQAGDTVTVVLYADQSAVIIPEELEECLAQEPGLLSLFQQLDQSEQKRMIDHINASSNVEVRTRRIVKLIEDLSKQSYFTNV